MSNHPLLSACYLLLSLLAPITLAADVLINPQRVNYGEAIGDNPKQWPTLDVYAWEGKHVAFLTATDKLDRRVMTRFVAELDKAFEWMVDVTGFTPKVGIARAPDESSMPFHWKGKASLNRYMSRRDARSGDQVDPRSDRVDPRSNRDYEYLEMYSFDYFEYDQLRKDPLAIAPRHLVDIAECFYDPKRRIPIRFGYRISMATIYHQHAKLKAYNVRDVYIVRYFGNWQTVIAKSGYPWEDLYFGFGRTNVQSRKTLFFAPPVDSKSTKNWSPTDATGTIVTSLYEKYGSEFVKRFYRQVHQLPVTNADHIPEHRRIQLVAMAACASIAAKRDLSKQFAQAWLFPLNKSDAQAIGALNFKDDNASAAALIAQLYPTIEQDIAALVKPPAAKPVPAPPAKEMTPEERKANEKLLKEAFKNLRPPVDLPEERLDKRKK